MKTSSAAGGGTAHHPGKCTRLVPLFPDLCPYLPEPAQEASNIDGLVIPRFHNADNNPRTGPFRSIAKAKLKPRPKVLQNLRASRLRELQKKLPTHVVRSWLGNSPRIAHRHDLQTTKEHFERAQQHPVQQAAVEGGMVPSVIPKRLRKHGSCRRHPTIRSQKASRDGIRTRTPLNGTRDFKSRASACSATRPECLLLIG